MNKMLLVARRELRVTASRKSFVISTALTLVLIVASAFVAQFFIAREAGPEETVIGLSAELADLRPTLQATGVAMGRDIMPILVESDVASDRLIAGEIEAWLGGTLDDLELRFKSAPADMQLEQLVTAAVGSYALESQILALGGNPQEVLASVGAASTQTTFAQDNDGVGTDVGKLILAWAVLFLLFLGIVMSGSMISMGVVEEKSSRVVELLLATITPVQLFAGKVLGVGVLAMGQVAAYAVAAVAAASMSGLMEGLSVPVGPHLIWLAVWFVIGFSMFVVLWGGVSAMASRQEDVGAVTGPMMFLLIVPFYVAMYLPTNAPNSLASQITSMAPFTAPFVMPVRQVFVNVPAWELAVSILVSLATVAVCVWLGSRVYHRGVLHTGARMTFREALGRGAARA